MIFLICSSFLGCFFECFLMVFKWFVVILRGFGVALDGFDSNGSFKVCFEWL